VPDPSTEPTADSVRLFVAIELPGEVREALSRLQHELQRRGLEKLRWVRPEGIHLTLKFLGGTPPEKVPEIETALTDAAKGVVQHELTLGELGTFGGSRPRVFWVDLRGDLARSLPGAIEGVRVPAGVIAVREVSLMRSTLRPSGAVYERIAAFPLANA
jgi:RNA 2',3'-cyclic 3'-phosphodiesterase